MIKQTFNPKEYNKENKNVVHNTNSDSVIEEKSMLNQKSANVIIQEKVNQVNLL